MSGCVDTHECITAPFRSYALLSVDTPAHVGTGVLGGRLWSGPCPIGLGAPRPMPFVEERRDLWGTGHSTTVVVPRRFQHERVRRHSRVHNCGTERLPYARIGCEGSS